VRSKSRPADADDAAVRDELPEWKMRVDFDKSPEVKALQTITWGQPGWVFPSDDKALADWRDAKRKGRTGSITSIASARISAEMTRGGAAAGGPPAPPPRPPTSALSPPSPPGRPHTAITVGPAAAGGSPASGVNVAVASTVAVPREGLDALSTVPEATETSSGNPGASIRGLSTSNTVGLAAQGSTGGGGVGATVGLGAVTLHAGAPTVNLGSSDAAAAGSSGGGSAAGVGPLNGAAAPAADSTTPPEPPPMTAEEERDAARGHACEVLVEMFYSYFVTGVSHYLGLSDEAGNPGKADWAAARRYLEAAQAIYPMDGPTQTLLAVMEKEAAKAMTPGGGGLTPEGTPVGWKGHRDLDEK
jgi:hypothetical protein